jgi:hypothetical protein
MTIERGGYIDSIVKFLLDRMLLEIDADAGLDERLRSRERYRGFLLKALSSDHQNPSTPGCCLRCNSRTKPVTPFFEPDCGFKAALHSGFVTAISFLIAPIPGQQFSPFCAKCWDRFLLFRRLCLSSICTRKERRRVRNIRLYRDNYPSCGIKIIDDIEFGNFWLVPKSSLEVPNDSIFDDLLIDDVDVALLWLVAEVQKWKGSSLPTKIKNTIETLEPYDTQTLRRVRRLYSDLQKQMSGSISPNDEVEIQNRYDAGIRQQRQHYLSGVHENTEPTKTLHSDWPDRDRWLSGDEAWIVFYETAQFFSYDPELQEAMVALYDGPVLAEIRTVIEKSKKILQRKAERKTERLAWKASVAAWKARRKNRETALN